MAQKIIATVGAFDGIHRGHRALLEQLIGLGREHGLTPVAMTFSPRPAEVLRPELAPLHLAPLERNLELIRSYGVERVEVIPFDLHLAALTAEEFMLDLRDRLGLKALLIGYDHQFGRGAQLTYDDYREIELRLGIEVYRADALTSQGLPISSSRIRSLLAEARLSQANDLLGYAYRLGGSVIGGMRIGRTMGYPTANIALSDPRQLIPADGVYAVRVHLSGEVYCGMLYIGKRPTIDHGDHRTIEVNIFDLSADLYAQHLDLDLEAYIRSDQKFPSLQALQAQIARDEASVRAYFAEHM